MSYTRNLTFDQRIVATVNGAPRFYGPIRSSSRTGSRIMGYRDLIRQQREATSEFSATYYNYVEMRKAEVVFNSYFNPVPSIRMNGSYTGYPGSNQTFASVVTPNENEALSRLYANLRSTRSQMNGLLFFAELREAVTLIRNPARGLVRGFADWSASLGKRFRSDPSLRGRRNRQRLADVAADTWLEASFGWRPLVSDAKDIATTAARILRENSVRMNRVVGVSTRSATEPYEIFNTPDPAVSSWGASTMRWSRRRMSEAGVRFEAFLSSSLSGPQSAFERVAQVSGLTLENVVPTVYNIIPYTFLLDYASNLGDCVEAEFTDVSNVKFALKTVRQVDSVDVISDFDPKLTTQWLALQSYTPFLLSGTSGRVKEVRRSISRTRLPTLPTPVLEFTLTNSGSKLGNVVALLEKTLRANRL